MPPAPKWSMSSTDRQTDGQTSSRGLAQPSLCVPRSGDPEVHHLMRVTLWSNTDRELELVNVQLQQDRLSNRNDAGPYGSQVLILELRHRVQGKRARKACNGPGYSNSACTQPLQETLGAATQHHLRPWLLTLQGVDVPLVHAWRHGAILNSCLPLGRNKRHAPTLRPAARRRAARPRPAALRRPRRARSTAAWKCRSRVGRARCG